jgi:hypothetical protein
VDDHSVPLLGKADIVAGSDGGLGDSHDQILQRAMREGGGDCDLAGSSRKGQKSVRSGTVVKVQSAFGMLRIAFFLSLPCGEDTPIRVDPFASILGPVLIPPRTTTTAPQEPRPTPAWLSALLPVVLATSP